MTSGVAVPQDAPDQPLPMRFEDAAALERVAHALRSAGFDEATICRTFGTVTMAEVAALRRDERDRIAVSSPALGLFLRLFLFGEPVSRDAAAAVLGATTLEALLAVDLLRPLAGDPGRAAYCASVMLYPVGGMLIASDRDENPDGTPLVAPSDVVFPAIFHGTLRFLRVLPRSTAEDALDLCAGSGIGALVLSRSAKRAVSADITARSTHFAQFNCRLNRCNNVTVAQGDLYDAVAGRTFDRIVAHPPYVPAEADTHIFRDAGVTGETVLRRIIAGLPQVLRPGGAFYALCAGWDAKEQPFEARVREWLAAAANEFDLLFAVHHDTAMVEAARELALRADGDTLAELRRWRELWAREGLERAVYGALVLDRPGPASADASRPPITRRLRLGPLTDGAAFEWLLRWLRWRAAQEAHGELAGALLVHAPRLSPHLHVNVAHAPGENGLAVEDVVLETDRPFVAQTRIDPWMLPLVARLDGKQSGAAVYHSARQAHAMPEAFTTEDFARFVALMVERGYAEVGGLQLDA